MNEAVYCPNNAIRSEVELLELAPCHSKLLYMQISPEFISKYIFLSSNSSGSGYSHNCCVLGTIAVAPFSLVNVVNGAIDVFRQRFLIKKTPVRIIRMRFLLYRVRHQS